MAFYSICSLISTLGNSFNLIYFFSTFFLTFNIYKQFITILHDWALAQFQRSKTSGDTVGSTVKDDRSFLRTFLFSMFKTFKTINDKHQEVDKS